MVKNSFPIFSSDGKLGDIKIEDLPGPEALLRPGYAKIQMLILKSLYQCNQSYQCL